MCERDSVTQPLESSDDVHGAALPEGDAPEPAGQVVGEAEAIVTAEGEIRSGKLAGLTMTSAIWVLALPVLLQQTMQASVGLADAMIAGRLPDAITVPAIDAIGIGSYIIWFIGIAMSGLGIGGQAIIARAIGGGDVIGAEKALGQAVTLSVGWGVCVGAVLWGVVYPLGAMAQLSGEAMVMFIDYVHIICLAMPFAGLMLVGAMCLHGAGETTKPSLIAIGVNVVNIVASWALSGVDIPLGEWTLVNPFPFDLHVIGIAAGTTISYLFGAMITLWVMVRGVKDLKLEAKELWPLGPRSRRIARVGLPGFLDSIMMWSANLFVLIFIGMIVVGTSSGEQLRQGLQGAHFITIRWESFSFLPGFAVGTAAGALAGQYLGAGNPRLAKRAVLTCTGIGMVMMGAAGLVFMFEGDFLTRLVSSEPVHLRETPPLLFICGTIQIFFAINMVVRQGLRGVGDTKWTFLITTVSSYGIRLPAAWLLGVYLGLGLQGIWLALCGEIVVRSMLFTARFFHGGWKAVEV